MNKGIDTVFKKMMRNVNLSSKNRGSSRKSTQRIVNESSEYKRPLKVSSNGVVYREHKEHEINIDWEYLKKVWLDQDKKDYWFPEYEIELNEIFVPYSIKAPSVDRLDGSKGYVKGNVVLTTRFANLGRGNFGETDFRTFIKKLWNETRTNRHIG